MLPAGVLARRHTHVRDQLLAAEPSWTLTTLAHHRGSSAATTSQWAHRHHAAGRMLLIDVDGRTVIPDAQLTGDGDLDPDVAALMAALTPRIEDPWHLWRWLTIASIWADGTRPADLARTDLPRALAGARRYAGHVTAALRAPEVL